LEPGVDALVHISQISHKRIDKPEDVLNIGDEIKAKILDVNKEDEKIALSIKEVDEI
jgi:small subunit ribosomal protein S1